jgi:hypothetical protein
MISASILKAADQAARAVHRTVAIASPPSADVSSTLRRLAS